MSDHAQQRSPQIGESDSTLTAAEVQEFASSNGIWGYDRRETRRFLLRVAAALEAVEGRVAEIEQRKDAASEALLYAAEAAKAIERDARDAAETIVEDGRVRAARILADAQERREAAETIVEDARIRAARILGDAEKRREAAEIAVADAEAFVNATRENLSRYLKEAQSRLAQTVPLLQTANGSPADDDEEHPAFTDLNAALGETRARRPLLSDSEGRSEAGEVS